MKRKILLVEDDFANCSLIKKILSLETIDVDVAGYAELAWEKLKENDYDLFIVDLQLPFGTSGFELVSRVRSLDKYKDIPIIAITAYVGIFSEEDCLSKGFSYYVTKPFDIINFKDLVVRLLSKQKEETHNYSKS
ncbi:MAG: response regulator [Ignavibacteria bacterium]|nr:response regulator [Ignavibacteria bacterium]